MKVAVVVQRYGNEVVGGAETHSRKIAEHLKSDLNWDVEVITTTALDYRTWSNHFPKGESEVNGIKVKRFRTIFPRFFLFNIFHRVVCRYLPSLERRNYLKWLAPVVEKLWYVLQGPYSPALIRYIKDEGTKFDAIFYFTYLYYPTVEGIKLHSSRSHLIPEAHDEPPFYFRGTEDALAAAQSIIANTPSEIRLIGRRFYPAIGKIRTAGMGIDLVTPENLDLGEFELALNQPYLLYLGRVGPAKLVHILFDNFLEYLSKSGDAETKLVLAGGKDKGFSIPDHPQIQYIGFVTEEMKSKIIQKAVCVVNPSGFESLSIIVAEAITLKKPVMVNGHCEVLRDYRDLARTVFPYYTSAEFTQILANILKTDWKNDSVKISELQDAKVAIDDTFQWSNILSVYQQSIANELGKNSLL